MTQRMMTRRREPDLWIEVQSQGAALGAEPRRKAPGDQAVAKLRFETPLAREISRALRADVAACGVICGASTSSGVRATGLGMGFHLGDGLHVCMQT